MKSYPLIYLELKCIHFINQNLYFNKSVLLICFLTSSLVFVTNSSAITLDGFINEVKASNPELLAAKNRQQAQIRRVQPSSSWEDPFIAAGPDEIPFNGGMEYVIRYQINQTIPFPGKLDAKEKLARWQAENFQGNYTTMERQLIIGATQLFFQAILNQKALELNSQNVDLLRTSAASEKSRYDTGGAASHHQWLLASAELEILQTERMRLEKDKTYLHSLMNEMRNKSAKEEIGPLEFSFANEKNADEKAPTFEEMLQSQPEYKSVLAQVSFAKESLNQSKLGYFPDIMVQGMVMQSLMESQPSNWGVMVGITVPLFWFRKQSELVKAAQMENTANENERTALLNKIKTEWIDAHEQLKLVYDIFELYDKKIIPITKMAVDSILSDYKTRKASLRDLSDTLRVYKTQQLEHAAARLDIELAKLRIKELLISPGITTLSPRIPALFNGMNTGMVDSGMESTKPMRPAGGMKPPKQSTEKKDSMGGM